MLLYVWVTVSVYQSFRATTFVLLGLLFYRFLPVALAVGLLSHVLREIATRAPRPRSVSMMSSDGLSRTSSMSAL